MGNIYGEKKLKLKAKVIFSTQKGKIHYLFHFRITFEL